MAEPWEYWPTAQKRQREQKATDILQDLIKNTNLDTHTINDLVKSYVNEGTTKLPNMMQEGTQGPLEADQMRETPTNSLRPPAYVYDETSNKFNRAPEGVSDPIRQIREVNRFRNNSTAPRGNWYMDETGQWRRYESPNPPNRPTATQEKERLAIESAIAQLKTKKRMQTVGGMNVEEPITTREEALSVPVALGLDPSRYPEIQQAIGMYPESLSEEPKQMGFFESLQKGVGETAGQIGKGGKMLFSAVKGSLAPKNEQEETPVQLRKQESSQQELVRKTKSGKIAIYDARTKQFLRWQ